MGALLNRKVVLYWEGNGLFGIVLIYKIITRYDRGKMKIVLKVQEQN